MIIIGSDIPRIITFARYGRDPFPISIFTM